MKVKELKSLIRGIVREEVALSIKEVIKEIKAVPMPKSKPKPKQNFTKNSVINDVLNETAADKNWKSMGGGTYDSSRANEVLGSSYGDMMNNDTDKPNKQLAAEMGVDPNNAPDFLGLMKTSKGRRLPSHSISFTVM